MAKVTRKPKASKRTKAVTAWALAIDGKLQGIESFSPILYDTREQGETWGLPETPNGAIIRVRIVPLVPRKARKVRRKP